MAKKPGKKRKSANPEVAPDIDASADIDASVRRLAVEVYGPVEGSTLADRLSKARAALLANQPSKQSVYRAHWAGELEQQNDHLAFVEGLFGVSPVGDHIRAAMKRISALVDDIRGATDESFDEYEILGKIDDIDLELLMIYYAIARVMDQPLLASGTLMAIERVRIVHEEIANGEPLPPKRTIDRRRSGERRRKNGSAR
jgi:hypothetical protein